MSRNKDNEIIIYCLNKFFEDKSWHCGGNIPKKLLINERNIRLLRNADMITAVDIGYDAIERFRRSGRYMAETLYRGEYDVDLCLKIINEGQRLCIPQHYVGGIFLLYLELCEGVNIETGESQRDDVVSCAG